MKPSSQSPRTPSRLSDSVHHQLSQYALAASAAGVGVLALAQPADAKILYTPTHHIIRPHGQYNLDLNHDGVTDFLIHEYDNSCSDLCEAFLSISDRARSAGIVGKRKESDLFAYALNRGAKINGARSFGVPTAMFIVFTSGSGVATATFGYWGNVRDRYLGLRFLIDGKTHYGWARMSVKVLGRKITGTLTGYAYETIPNKPIIAGKTKGPDVITLEPGSLGALAAGASGRNMRK